MASNIVEILIGAKDDAKLDLDSLKAKLDELAHKVATAKVNVAGDKEAELELDQLGVKLTRLGKRSESSKVSLEGQYKMATEIAALDIGLDRLGDKFGTVARKATEASTATGLDALANAAAAASATVAAGAITVMESSLFSGAGATWAIIAALGFLVAIISGPLIASLAPIALGFAAFGAGAVGEIKKVITAHQQLQAAQAAYEKATTPAGKASALRAEKLATEDLSGSEKGLLGLLGQLGQMFHKLQAAVQPQVIKAFGSVLKIIRDLMPTLIPLAQAAGKAIDGFLKNIDKWLNSDSGKKFLQWMRVDGPNAIKRFGMVLWDVAQFIGQTFDFLRNAGDTWWKNVHAVISHVEHGWTGLVAVVRGVASALAADWRSMVSQAQAIWAGIYAVLVAPIERAYHTISGIIGSIRGAISSIGSAVSGLGGVSGMLGHLGLAAGGIAGAASGGLRSGLTKVGERGPEYVQLSAGSRVYNNNQTRQIDAQGSGGGGVSTIVLDVRLGGVHAGRAIVDVVQGHVRTAGGGDVQVALGTS